MSRRYEVEQGSASSSRQSGRKVTIKVCMLDDSVVKFDVEVRRVKHNASNSSTWLYACLIVVPYSYC